jgi:hypothetical protein
MWMKGRRRGIAAGGYSFSGGKGKGEKTIQDLGSKI